MEKEIILTENDFPTEDEWNAYEYLFRSSKESLSIVRKLRAGGNFPLRTTKSDNPEITRVRIGAMNHNMERKKFRHKFRRYDYKVFDYIYLKHEVRRE